MTELRVACARSHRLARVSTFTDAATALRGNDGGIAVDSSGNLYFPERSVGNRILRMTPAGVISVWLSAANGWANQVISVASGRQCVWRRGLQRPAGADSRDHAGARGLHLLHLADAIRLRGRIGRRCWRQPLRQRQWVAVRHGAAHHACGCSEHRGRRGRRAGQRGRHRPCCAILWHRQSGHRHRRIPVCHRWPHGTADRAAGWCGHHGVRLLGRGAAARRRRYGRALRRPRAALLQRRLATC